MYISAIMKPFLYNITPHEAKQMIEELPHEGVRQLIFKKGLVNILPEKISVALKNNLESEDQKLKQPHEHDAVSDSGSTRSDDLAKLHHKEHLLFDKPNEKDDHERFSIQDEIEFEEPEMLKGISTMVIHRKNSDINYASPNIRPKFDDVNALNLDMKNLPKLNIVIEEEKVGELSESEESHAELLENTANQVIDTVKQTGEFETFEFIPINGSSVFHKEDNSKAYREFTELLNVRTRVISCSKPDLVGQSRSIFSEKQLGRINCMINQKSSTSPSIQALVQPNRISEEDVFWDNFWLFKKKEEEKRVLKEQDSDSDSDEHKQDLKLGDYMKNPQILLQIMLKKHFRKIRRNLIFVNSIGGITIMSLLMIIQLRYSPKFRKYAKNLFHLLMFLFTIVGFGGSVFLLYKGIRSRLRKQRSESNENYNIKNEELPELKPESILSRNFFKS